MPTTLRQAIAGFAIVLTLLPPAAPVLADELGGANTPASSDTSVSVTPSASSAPADITTPPAAPDAPAPTLPTGNTPAMSVNVTPNAAAPSAQASDINPVTKGETSDKTKTDIITAPKSETKPGVDSQQAQATTSGPPPRKE